MSHDETHYLERELREQFRNNPEIFDFLERGSLDGVWYWDLEDPGHEWLSPRFKQIFGFADAEMEHTPEWWQANIFPEDLEVVLENFERHSKDPEHPYDQVVRYRHRDGSTVWIRCRGIIIRGPDGTPRRMLGAHQDVTASKRAEQQAQAAVDALLQRRDEDFKRLRYIISHDLRAPLRGVRGFGQVLLQDLEEGASAELLRDSAKRMVGAAERMQEMLDALMSLARVRGEPGERERVDLGAIAEEAVHDHASEIEAKGAEVRVAEGLPHALGNAAQLRSLLSNLVGNAVKYADPKRPLRIDVRAEGGARVQVEVQDTGRGFDVELFDRATTPFVQLQGSGEFPGLGMGLALCQEIADLHGGELSAQSEPGVGSTFRFTLPAAEGR